jgi:beta-glucanase (GH16 family)
MGLHPFGDPRITDEFAAELLPIDARDFHVYAAEWTPERVAFFVDDGLVKVVRQSPGYPMQLMLGVYALPEPGGGPPPGPWPKELVVDRFRGFRRRPG